MTHQRIFVLGGSLLVLACGGEEPQTQGFSASVGTAKAELTEEGAASGSASSLQTLTGKFLTFVVEGSGPEAGTKRYLEPNTGGPPVKLEFATPPDWRSGVEMQVRGLLQDGVFEVADYEVFASDEPTLYAPPKSRSIGFIAIDVNGGGVRYPSGAATPQVFMFGTTNPGPNAGLSANEKSVVQFYSEASYGRFQFTGAVEGPIAYPGNICGSSLSNWYANTRTVSAQIATKYDHYVYYNGTKQAVCSYGQGSLGTAASPTGSIWFNGDLFDGAIPHELGHNLGLEHASSIKCSGVPLADDPLTCTTEEYGSPVDIMGNLFAGQMIVSEKWYLGWISGCNGVRVKASGTFNLLPLENACNGGILGLQIPMPKDTRKFSTEQGGSANAAKFYYLEYRAGIGLDTGLPKQVSVHVSDDIRPSNRAGARTISLDMKPSTNAKDGMVAGDTYTDPAGGVTFKVDSMDATKAVVTVTLANGSGASTCIDGSMLQGSGPETCSGSGTGGGAGMGGSTGSGGSAGKGGGTGTGGAGGTGGARTGGAGGQATGGAGGMKATGGAFSSGGASSSGGSAGSGGGAPGGSTSTGGATSTTGGTNASGGAGGNSVAGATTTGGSVASGGAPSTMGGAGNLGGAVSTAGSAGTPTVGPSSADAGCGCRMQNSGTGGSAGFLAALGMLVFGLRRRRTPRIDAN